MKNFMILTDAINYIEDNLCEPITRKEIADHCYISLSALEKLFRYALKRSIKEYIERRRMTQAAHDLLKSEAGVTELAMKYGFNSSEVFTRAFQRIWNTCPSDFTKKWKNAGIFPRINYQFAEGDDLEMARKRMDVSEAYDMLRSKQGSYVLCFDMKNLVSINNISMKLGDLALLEMYSRIDAVSTEDMLPLRVGGDEFVLITGLYDETEAARLCDEVLSKNGNTVLFEGKEYPVSLWGGITTVPEHLRYTEFFSDVYQTLMNSKK